MSGELAGLLRERITLLHRAPGTDAEGGAAEIFQPLGVTWAAVQQSGVGADFIGEAFSALPHYTITLRLRTDIIPGDRMIWRGYTLVILSLIADPLTPDRMTCLTEQIR